MKQQDYRRRIQQDAPMMLPGILSGILICVSRISFYMEIPVLARLFFPTVLPTIFWRPPTVFFIFLLLICLTVLLRQPFPENQSQIREMNLFLTATC